MKLHYDEPMRGYNTLALKARANALACVTDDAELLQALAWARANGFCVVPLGQGSNVVFAGDLHALVVRQAARGVEVLEMSSSHAVLRVAAGENWHELVQWTLHEGYYGLENLALIPGTVGASPIQNIGAYGVELQAVLLQVHAIQIVDDKKITLDNAACEFSYRDSIFKRNLKDQLVITAIDIKLSRRPSVDIRYPALADFFAARPQIEPTPQTVFDAVVAVRSSKLPDPSVEPNAGSFFKNPLIRPEALQRLLKTYPRLPCFTQIDGTIKISAAWMIEHCGWKGMRRHDLGVHPKHALVLVNYGSGSGEDLLALSDEITASVYNTFGVQLAIEPRVYGLSA